MEKRCEASFIIQEARKWLNTPYLHNQKACGFGTDCIGYAVEVYKAAGAVKDNIELPTRYDQEPTSDIIQLYLEKYLKRTDKITPGAIALFKFKTFPQHVGIITWIEKTKAFGLLHSSLLHKRVVEHTFGDDWLRWLIGIYEPENLVNDLWPT